MIRTILLTILTCLPALASANQMPHDLSTDRAMGVLDPSFAPGLAYPVPGLELEDLTIDHPTEAKAQALASLDPNLDLEVARRAIEAMYCAQDKGVPVDKVIVVDMSAPASTKRLWAFDLRDTSKPRLVINERVAHGGGSDRDRDGQADKFSNTPNSHMTSLGLYKIAERYHGKNGWSRRLDGLFAKFNGKARDRAVVMHPSTYVSAQRVGYSQGCPAVSQATMDALEKAGLKNAVLWIDGPDKALEQAVADCAEKRKAKELAAVVAKREAQLAQAWTQQTTLAFAPTLVQGPAYQDEQVLDATERKRGDHGNPAPQTLARRLSKPEAVDATEQQRGDHGNPPRRAHMVDSTPTPLPRDEFIACELTAPRSPRFAMPDCPIPIDTMANGHRLI